MLIQGLLSVPTPFPKVSLSVVSEKMLAVSTLWPTRLLLYYLAFTAFCFFIILHLQRCSIYFWDCGIREQKITRKVTENLTSSHNEFWVHLYPCFSGSPTEHDVSTILYQLASYAQYSPTGRTLPSTSQWRHTLSLCTQIITFKLWWLLQALGERKSQCF